LLAKSDNPAMIGALGRYEVKRVIGAGGTGIVLQAVDTELNRTVAIKVLAPVLAAHGPARKRFARESQAVAAVAHENVVAVHHVEGGGRVPYLVMQYVDGDSLQDLVIRDGPLDVTTTLRMTAQLAAALAAAHDQGLVHRDVKPANILVGPVGQRVWMTDFGLARAVDDASLTRTGFIAGTPHYMSPEQARGATVRSSSDLFGLGGVVYFMLTGRPPFRAERTLAILNRICTEPHRPVREVNPGVPTTVAKLVDRLLAKSAADRFVNAEAVRAECLRLLADRVSPDDDSIVILADEQTASVPVPRSTTRRRAVRWAVGLAFLAGSVAVIAHLSGRHNLPFRDERLATAPVAADGMSEEPGANWDEAIAIRQIPTESEATAQTASVANEIGDTAPAQFNTPYDAPTPTGNSQPSLEPYPPPQYNGSFAATPWRAAEPPLENNDLNRQIPASPRAPTGNAKAPLDVARETTVDEPTVWQIGFHELEQALTALETQLMTVDNPQAATSLVVDHFDGTIRWMEATVRDMEDELPLLPATSEPDEVR
jgi:serine/threonine protein kinase